MKQIFSVGVALIVLSVFVLSSLAIGATQSKLLDGKTYVGQMGEKGKGAEFQETLVFKEGTFRSKACDPLGFTAGPYGTTTQDGETRFTAVCSSPREGRIFWKGTVKGDLVEATSTWRKPGQEDRPIVYWVKAKLQKKM
ncbi:MAG: hypothetical protein HYU64_15750 [Armatimonadetes bacterium]|nr:hypothetical protein [Armatimonadota bacterium]